MDDAPVDGRTDALIPVIVLSQKEAGSALSALSSLALDSYRKMLPTRSPSLVIFLSPSLPPPPFPVLYSLQYAVCETSSHSTSLVHRECETKKRIWSLWPRIHTIRTYVYVYLERVILHIKMYSIQFYTHLLINFFYIKALILLKYI